MSVELDPADGMPSRAALAQEVLGYRMRQLSETFFSASWVDDLEFDVWEMAHSKPHRFGGHDVGAEMAKYFRDLAILAGGWWVWPDTVGREREREIFIPLDEWKTILAQQD